jgi:hypothetical protein
LSLTGGRLTTPFTTQNRSKPDRDFIDVRSRERNKASTSKDIWSSEGSGGDARRTSYTLPPNLTGHELATEAPKTRSSAHGRGNSVSAFASFTAASLANSVALQRGHCTCATWQHRSPPKAENRTFERSCVVIRAICRGIIQMERKRPALGPRSESGPIRVLDPVRVLSASCGSQCSSRSRR